MGREVRFSFLTDEEAEEFRALAEYRGLTISALLRVALYDYRNRHPGPGKRPPRAAAVLSRGNSEEV